MKLVEMNKTQIFFTLFFVQSAAILAQTPDSIPVFLEKVVEKEEVFTEHDLVRDSINNSLVPISNENFPVKILDEDFRSHYSGSEFQYEVREENDFLAKLRNWWKRISDFFKRNNDGTTSIVFDEIVNILLAFLLLIGLGFLIYYLNKKGFIRLFAKKEMQVINEKYIEENIDKIDFATLTHQAKQENDLRKAVRYYYLWLLKNWSQSEIIHYEPNKTTKTYLTELQQSADKTAFQYVSYIYDNVWYGYHEISENDFIKIEQQFVQLINKAA